MPELTAYPTDANELDKIAATEIAQRSTEITQAWDYYDGDQRKPLKIRKNQPDDNVIVNLTQRVIDQSVSMLFGETPRFETPAGDDALTALWKSNNVELFLNNLAVAGAVTGHPFVKLIPEPGRVRFVLLNTQIVTVFWRPDDMQSVVCYSIGWTQGETRYRQDIVNQGPSWLVRDMNKPKNGNWNTSGEALWPYPFAPIVDWQNMPDSRCYYGQGDIVNLPMNDAVNFVASNINRILKYHAHPKTILIGAQSKQIEETSVDGLWTIANENAKASNLEMQSDLASSMTFLDFLRTSFYSQHRTVDLSSMKDKIGGLTNFGLRVLFKDALDKLTTKRTLYANGLEEISYRSGVILGRDWSGATIQWGDPLPFNDKEEVDVLSTEIGLGILSRQTASESLGNDWELEQQRMADEKAAQVSTLGATLASLMADPGAMDTTTMTPAMMPNA